MNKKIRKIAASAAALFILTGCARNNVQQNSGGSFPDIAKTAENIREFYSDNVELVFMSDEYSDEVLMFTYGLEDEKYTAAIEDFVLSECDGMSADTFALIKFKPGTDSDLVAEAASIMEDSYVESLKSRLAAYNPEEYAAASDKRKLIVYDDAILFVISSKHADEIVSAASVSTEVEK